MIRWFFLLLAFPVLSFAESHFEILMGKKAPHWKHVKTPEDFQRLEFYKNLFEKNQKYLRKIANKQTRIPKTIHFIWLGPQEFPKSSCGRIKKWIELHPDWTFHFWTDIDRDPPVPGMNKQLVSNFSFSKLESCYFDSINVGEKSKILAYEILFQNGGIYVDHDVSVLKSFDHLNAQFDFYCGLEQPQVTVLSSSIVPGTQLIASIPRHSAIGSAMEWLNTNWDLLERSFPGNSREASKNRVLHRAYSALSFGIDRGINHKGNRDIVFPTSYFNGKNRKASSYAVHLHDEKWVPVMALEHKIDFEFKTMNHENNFVKVSLLFSGTTLLFIIFLLIFKKKGAIFLLLFAAISGFAEGDEFKHLMGEGTEHWIHVKGSEDLHALEQFQTLYEKNKHLRFTNSGEYKIPKVIHIIWLGPKAFPPESVENIRSWIAHHPDWTFKFWTDRERFPPCNGMEICDVNQFLFLFLQRCYEESDNWGEKSDILRFEILYQEGGMYIDHDAGCLTSFKGMHKGYDFYCCLEVPHPPINGRNITTGIGLLGSKPYHPVIGRVIEMINSKWVTIGQKYQGRDGYSRTRLVMERTYMILTYALQDKLQQDGNADIVFPAAYFFAKKGIPSLYSKHYFGNTWADGETGDKELQHCTTRAFSKLMNRSKYTVWIARGTLSLNLMAFIGAFFYIARRKRK